MTILRMLADSLSSLKKSIEAILHPELDGEEARGALVKVRLADLLPPELPGWTSRNTGKRW